MKNIWDEKDNNEEFAKEKERFLNSLGYQARNYSDELKLEVSKYLIENKKLLDSLIEISVRAKTFSLKIESVSYIDKKGIEKVFNKILIIPLNGKNTPLATFTF